MPPCTTSTLSSRASCCAYLVYSAMSDCVSYWIDLDLAAEQAAGGVDLLDRQLRGHHHRLAVDVEVAGVVEHRAELDRRALRQRQLERNRRAQSRQAGGRAGRGEKVGGVEWSCCHLLWVELWIGNGRDAAACRSKAGASRRSAWPGSCSRLVGRGLGRRDRRPTRSRRRSDRRCSSAPAAAAPCRGCCPSPASPAACCAGVAAAAPALPRAAARRSR